jgi:hypothetical protein
MVHELPAPQVCWQHPETAHVAHSVGHILLQSFGLDCAVSELAHVLSPQNPLDAGQSPAQFPVVSPPSGLQQLSPQVPVVAAQSAGQLQRFSPPIAQHRPSPQVAAAQSAAHEQTSSPASHVPLPQPAQSAGHPPASLAQQKPSPHVDAQSATQVHAVSPVAAEHTPLPHRSSGASGASNGRLGELLKPHPASAIRKTRPALTRPWSERERPWSRTNPGVPTTGVAPTRAVRRCYPFAARGVIVTRTPLFGSGPSPPPVGVVTWVGNVRS